MARDDEDLRPAAGLVAAPPLDRLGVAELQAYIANLRTEIARTEAEIAKKEGLRSAADRFFKRGA